MPTPLLPLLLRTLLARLLLPAARLARQQVYSSTVTLSWCA